VVGIREPIPGKSFTGFGEGDEDFPAQPMRGSMHNGMAYTTRHRDPIGCMHNVRGWKGDRGGVVYRLRRVRERNHCMQ
jgi:hypothetical protein